VLSLPTVLIWPLLFLGPWLLKRVLNISAPQTPVLFAAVFATFIYLFAEQYITKDTEKDDIKQLVQSLVIDSTSSQARYQAKPLYQAKPGDGAVSFYANRPIQPLDGRQLEQLLVVNKTLWLLSKDKPILEDGVVMQEKQIGRWTLWKIVSK
jgi:hypothetical protein